MTVVVVDQIDYLNPLLKPVDQAGDSGVYLQRRNCGQLYKLSSSCKDSKKLEQLDLDYPIRIISGSKTEAWGVRADRIRLVGGADPGFTSVFVTADGFLQTYGWPFITKHEPKDDGELTSPCHVYLNAKEHWLLCTTKHLEESFIESEAAARLYKIERGISIYKVPCRSWGNKADFRHYYRKSDLAGLRPRYTRNYYHFLSDLKHVPPNFENYMTREELELYDRLVSSGCRRRHQPDVLSFDNVKVDFSRQDRLVRLMYQSFKDSTVRCCEEDLFNPSFTWEDLETIKEQLYITTEKPKQFSIEQVLYWDLEILDQFLAKAGYSEFERIKILNKVDNFRRSTGRKEA